MIHRLAPVMSLVVGAVLSSVPDARAADYTVQSPGGNIKLTVTHDKRSGALTYRVQSAGATVLENGALGITTSQGDFTSGLKFVREARQVVNETYRLPVGKRSTYLNHAHELELAFTKGQQEMRLRLRAYDDGIAFRYVIPGSGPIEISGESTTFPLGGANLSYWGQAHPNNYGYESPLGPLTADRISMPVLAELKDRKHFVFVAQAASYQSYVIPNYGKSKGVGIMVWGKVANKTFLNTPERAEAWMANLEKLGIGGAKVDFFDQRDTTVEKTDDLEDTQQRLFVRDFLSEIAARHQLVVEFHGCAVPSGERRRWPHVMSAEAVYGMERRNQILQHDLTIPYVRNIMGPVSFTPIHLSRSAGSHAYQLGQAVLYETGIQIFAERHDRILGFEGVELLKALPSAWDEIQFIDGTPSSHAVFARRKGAHWFVGGITDQARTAQIPLSFLAEGASYQADIYREGDAKTSIVKESKTLTRKDTLSIPMRPAGGFAVYLKAR